MKQRARVEREVSPGLDDYNNPLPAEWTEHIAELPVWLYGSTEREAVTEERTAVVTDLRVMAPLSADVTEKDRLGGDGPAVVDRRGSVIEPGPLYVEAVLRKRTHLECMLSKVAS
jgi:hypothetical protein